MFSLVYQILLFVITIPPCFDLLFFSSPPWKKRTKLWLMLFCFDEFLISCEIFSWYAYVPDIVQYICSVFSHKHSGKAQRYLLTNEMFNQNGFSGGECSTSGLQPKMILSVCVITLSTFSLASPTAIHDDDVAVY